MTRLQACGSALWPLTVMEPSMLPMVFRPAITSISVVLPVRVGEHNRGHSCIAVYGFTTQ